MGHILAFMVLEEARRLAASLVEVARCHNSSWGQLKHYMVVCSDFVFCLMTHMNLLGQGSILGSAWTWCVYMQLYVRCARRADVVCVCIYMQPLCSMCKAHRLQLFEECFKDTNHTHL